MITCDTCGEQFDDEEEDFASGEQCPACWSERGGVLEWRESGAFGAAFRAAREAEEDLERAEREDRRALGEREEG